jgi:hypothetical protein
MNAVDLFHLSPRGNSLGAHPVGNVSELCLQFIHQLCSTFSTVIPQQDGTALALSASFARQYSVAVFNTRSLAICALSA